MTNKHGDFIWYELMTSDADGAREFYSAVVGWDIEGKSDAPMDYRMISASDGPVAGLMPLTAEMQSGGARSCWMGYVLVDDVDASAEAVKAAGGSIHMEPWDIPGIGRMAYVADPQGVLFYTMKPTPPADRPDAQSTSFAAMKPMVGHCAWNELSTTDPEAAKAFYGRTSLCTGRGDAQNAANDYAVLDLLFPRAGHRRSDGDPHRKGRVDYSGPYPKPQRRFQHGRY
jgi:predicted enzyme related to lactoylglutathione lyase